MGLFNKRAVDPAERHKEPETVWYTIVSDSIPSAIRAELPSIKSVSYRVDDAFRDPGVSLFFIQYDIASTCISEDGVAWWSYPDMRDITEFLQSSSRRIARMIHFGVLVGSPGTKPKELRTLRQLSTRRMVVQDANV